jgi:hypothetical protein
MGGVYANTLGSAAHELGHVFELGHANVGIMARDFERINCFFDVEACFKVNNRRSTVIDRSWWHRSAFAILSFHEHLNRRILSEGFDRDFWTQQSCTRSGLVVSTRHSTSYFRFDEQKYVIWSRFGVRLLDFRDDDGRTLCFKCYPCPVELIRLDDPVSLDPPLSIDPKKVEATSILVMDWKGHCLKLEN